MTSADSCKRAASAPGIASRFPHRFAALGAALALTAALAIPGISQAQAESNPASDTVAAEITYTFSPRFGTRKTDLSQADRKKLDEIAATWKGRSALTLVVTGHTDNVPIAPRNRGEFADNRALSLARAKSVAEYLGKRLGMDAASIRIVGMGARQPVASNATPAGRAKNRRVDVTLRSAPAMATRPPASGAQPGPALLERARVLIDQGRASEALALLKGAESALIGNGDFDYLYGLAALEAGETGEAMFALQRAVELDPAYAAARMELARAHFQTGDLPEAKRQFEMLAAQNPPPTARAAINQRLAAIERLQSMREPRTNFYVKTAAGYDSNANSATSLNSFLGFDLNDQSQETSSSFAAIGGGVRHLRPQSRTLVLDTRLDASHRANFDASFIDSTGARASVALRQETGSQIRSLSVTAFRQHVDGDLNSQGAGLAGQWALKVGDRWQLGVLGRVGTTRYGDELEVKDVNEYLGGLTAAVSVGDADQGSVGLSLLYGMDDPVNDGSRYARDVYGLRAFGSWAFSSRLQGSASLGVLRADYDEIFFPLEYSEPREDTLSQARLAAWWKFKPSWVLNPSVAWYSNSTDVEIFDFDRFELMLSVSRLW